MPEQQRIDHIAVSINGSNAPLELMDDLYEAMIDSSLNLPDMFVLRFHDSELQWVDSDLFEPGSRVEIALGAVGEEAQRVMDGEITAIEPAFDADLSVLLTVRGYDRSHRLNREPKTRVFVQVTDSDIVQQIASEAGLQAQTDSTPEVYDHVFQDNRTDLEFLQQRAERIGYEMFVDGETVTFREPRGDRSRVELEWGDTLRSFRPRLSVAHQVERVTVRGWDPAQKREVVGEANSSQSAPQTNAGSFGGDVASRAFSPARSLVVRRPVASQTAADALAQAILDDINANFVEAEGTASGNPRLLAGTKAQINKVGDRFGGSYLVTSATHVYSTRVGYEVDFRVEGVRPVLLSELAGTRPFDGAGTWAGVFPAIVTNNNDPSNMARVKVKFPWLNGDLESTWARVSSVGAGAERGVFWLPEVNDEVLVAFEHGEFDRPYVVGGLWNGEDAPPENASQAVSGGKVKIRTIRSRTGHTIRLLDNENGDQYIEIVDAKEGTRIKLDARSKELSIACEGNVMVKAERSMQLTAQGDVAIEAGGSLKLKGRTVDVDADTTAAVTGGTALNLKGAQLKDEGTAAAELTASGNLTIRGALVRIN